MRRYSNYLFNKIFLRIFTIIMHYVMKESDPSYHLYHIINSRQKCRNLHRVYMQSIINDVED